MKERFRQLLVWLLEWVDGIQISESRKIWAKTAGTIFDQQDNARAEHQSRCNHRKGGMVPLNSHWTPAIVHGLENGDANQYAVCKHQMMNGDIWVDCLRCGKKWRPVLRSQFKNDREFYKAFEEYETARKFPTNNTTSSSIQCRFRNPKTGRDANIEITKMYAAIGG